VPLIARGEDTGTRPERAPFMPSEQQARFLEAIRHGTSHLLLEARAGSGKSTTCREGASALPRGLKAWYACFNAHIAREFQEDLPPSCRARTLHSFGLELLRSKLGEVQIDNDKVDRLAERYFPDRWQRPERRAVADLVGLCKNQLIPVDLAERLTLLELATQFDVELPLGSLEEVLGVVPEVLWNCRTELASIDFDDMIWLPVILDLRPARPADVLFVDEAQDLNACQHELVDRLCPTGRLVVVGDRFQSIYRFRGADAESIPNFEHRLAASPRGLETYPLTVTRRCPVRHVELARRIVPDLDHLPTAIAGEVEEIRPELYGRHLEAGDMVLCRTNAPLVSACYRLLRDGTKAVVRGRDIGKGLLAFLARLRAANVADLVRRIADHRIAEAEKLAGLRNPAPALQTLNDKCDCLLALTESATSLDEVRQRCESLFSDQSEDGAVVLSSVHRAKGLERDRILILRPDLLPGPWAERPEDQQQERNLAYVASTRAKRRLTFAGPLPAILGGLPTVRTRSLF
jgi:DNA helicase II / ATP-dependent DNA helicase PcrA